jgi:hypothetical protein
VESQMPIYIQSQCGSLGLATKRIIDGILVSYSFDSPESNISGYLKSHANGDPKEVMISKSGLSVCAKLNGRGGAVANAYFKDGAPVPSKGCGDPWDTDQWCRIHGHQCLSIAWPMMVLAQGRNDLLFEGCQDARESIEWITGLLLNGVDVIMCSESARLPVSTITLCLGTKADKVSAVEYISRSHPGAIIGNAPCNFGCPYAYAVRLCV